MLMSSGKLQKRARRSLSRKRGLPGIEMHEIQVAQPPELQKALYREHLCNRVRDRRAGGEEHMSAAEAALQGSDLDEKVHRFLRPGGAAQARDVAERC
jgi:hypothetical protein